MLVDVFDYYAERANLSDKLRICRNSGHPIGGVYRTGEVCVVFKKWDSIADSVYCLLHEIRHAMQLGDIDTGKFEDFYKTKQVFNILERDADHFANREYRKHYWHLGWTDGLAEEWQFLNFISGSLAWPSSTPEQIKTAHSLVSRANSLIPV